jgi:predicted RNA binding protein YcfA (HicA-like mRNA interferase family)
LKLPRDLSGVDLAARLGRYGYRLVRQTGSHMRLASVHAGTPHRVTVPDHHPLRIGTLSRILDSVADYLDLTREELLKRLFE